MVRDQERLARIERALESHGLDALVCTLPSNVRLASGYWPVIGSAIAVVTRAGAIAVLVPDDEAALAADGWADAVCVFPAGSLDVVASVVDAVKPHLRSLTSAAGMNGRGRIGIEGASYDPAVYASGFSYGASLLPLLSSAWPNATLLEATDAFAHLRSTLTAAELVIVRHACDLARIAFEHAAAEIRVGMSEHEIADLVRHRLRDPSHHRAGGYVYCMSGPNAARAYMSFQQSTSRATTKHDQVLIHCNSCIAGLWTDITRTFSFGPPSDEVAARLEAIFTARQKAIETVRVGVPAADIDFAARTAMARAGFQQEFRHPTGHGIGFAAIDHNAVPRLHPRSVDVLEEGMVFNVEPAAYVAGSFGIRHCDMVAVGHDGPELLTAFQQSAQDLQLAV